MISVLIVDDSAFARKVLRETLTEEEGFALVGYARDGLEALELITQHTPQVITLDLVMPNLDGLGLLRALRDLPQPPRVVVVSMAGADSSLGIEALQEGAFDLVQKPTASPTMLLYDLRDELREKVRAAAGARPPRAPAPPPPRVLVSSSTRNIVVVGTSTGGPPALTQLLSALPANFPVPVAMVLHIPIGYTHALAARLNEVCALKVCEATEGLRLEPGLAVLAQAGQHLRLVRDGTGWRAQLTVDPVGLAHRPSVDVLFESVCAPQTLALVLTGMGDDGLRGSHAIVKAGGTVLTEAESSCVVYGMPRAVDEARLSAAQAPIDQMGSLLARYL